MKSYYFSFKQGSKTKSGEDMTHKFVKVNSDSRENAIHAFKREFSCLSMQRGCNDYDACRTEHNFTSEYYPGGLYKEITDLEIQKQQ